LRAEIEAINGGPLVELLATETWIYFGHGKPAALRAIMPFVFHVHGKFFQVDESGNDDAVAYPEIIDILVSSGYDGWISSEYEGHHWLKNRGAYAQVQAHQRYLRRLIDESEASKLAIKNAPRRP
jgi:sugar phosphate isomerase/epimerase